MPLPRLLPALALIGLSLCPERIEAREVSLGGAALTVESSAIGWREELSWTEFDEPAPEIGAAPALFYADWSHPIPEHLTALRAYRARLVARPSFARCIEEARPYRGFFPLGAPDRD